MSMRPHQTVIAVLLLLLLSAAWLWYGEEPTTTARGSGATTSAAPGSTGTADAAPIGNGPAPPLREGIAPPPEPEFVSKDEDGNVIVDAVRDGLTVLALRADRSPCARTPIDVRWRKGFGRYGKDSGRTDPIGRFVTTVAEAEMLESITLDDPVLGQLENGQDMLPMVSDPRTVCVVVPVMAEVALLLLDLQQRPIASGTITCEHKAIDSVPREFALACAEPTATTDELGRAVLRLPVGHHEFTATADGHRALQILGAEVPAAGRSLTLTLLREPRHEVAVTVNAPPDLTAPIEISAFSDFVPEHLLRQERTTSESVQRRFVATRTDARHFTVVVDELPWRLAARAEGHEWAAVDVPATQATATITLRPPRRTTPGSKARLRIEVVVPAGSKSFPVVRVHETPDLIHGSDHELDRDGRVVIELDPKGRVCVSARVMFHLPPTIVGPIELTAGDHDVRIELVAPQVVRGRVVDASGKPVAADVHLRRPAGPLRQLGEHVPDILPSSADGDTLGVGDGVFCFKDVGPGTHELYARPVGFGWPGRIRVEPGDENVVLVLGQGMQDMALVSGTVTDAGTGQPIADAQLSCGNEAAADSTWTDALGRFALALPPGSVTVTGAARRCVLHRSRATFAAGQTRYDITMLPSPPLFVRIIDAAGAALAGVEVGAVDAEGAPIELIDAQGHQDGESTDTDRAGRAELRGLPDGALRLVLQRGATKKEVAVPAGTPRDAVFEVRW